MDISFLECHVRRLSPCCPPPASPSLEPLDGCVSTDSELIKSYLSSAVDTEPSRLACADACVPRGLQEILCPTSGQSRRPSRRTPLPNPPPSLPPCPHPSPLWSLPGWKPLAWQGWCRVVGERAGGGGRGTGLLISSHPLPGSWVPGTGRFGQEDSREVIITCLSFSRDM